MSLLKKIMSLGMAGMILLGYPSNISFAMTGDDIQEAQGESGYRLYADELTPTAGVIKGDISGVLPDNEIINVRQPDGSVVLPEEVNYSITESGDYTFEIYYEASVENSQQEEHVESQAETQLGVTENKEESSNIGENIQAEETGKSEEITIENEEKSESVTETKKALSESLDISVVLPEEQSSEEMIEDDPQVIDDTPPQNTTYKSNSVSMQTNQTSISPLSWGGYDEYNSNKKWSTSDFTDKWMYASNQHMNWGAIQPPAGSIDMGSIGTYNDSKLGAKFTFGANLGYINDMNKAHWLQQGSAFSDISFYFNKDFALKGSMRIGNSFGSNSDAIDSKNINIDGGLTISFIPSDKVTAAKNNSRDARGSAYRLGAYGVMPNSIILEFDTSTDLYYDTKVANPGDIRSFVIHREDLEKTGDFNYTSRGDNLDGNAWGVLNGKNIYDTANGSNQENVAHIGISTTGDNAYVASSNESSDRVAIGSSNTGTINYEVQYTAGNREIKFMIWEADGDLRTATMNLSTFFSKNSVDKPYKLAFSYGAAYVDLTRYVNNNFFNDGSGTIDVWAKELYVSPELKTTDTKVRWLNSGTDVQQDNGTYNAYKQENGQMNYSNKALWPVAGDRIFVQFSFQPKTNVMPQPGTQLPGKLSIRVDDLSIKDNFGKTISGLSPGDCKFFYKAGNDGSWAVYSSSTPIDITEKTNEYFIRLQLKLPELLTNSSAEEYYVTGNFYADYQVGGSKITYKIPLMTENNNNISVSRPPKYIGWNGEDYYNNTRIVKSTDQVDVLRNVSNMGSKDGTGSGGAGRKKSIHYGVGYKLFSTNTEHYLYQERNSSYDIKQFNYETATMDNLGNIESKKNVQIGEPDIKLDFSEDRRFILEYRLQDPNYRKTNKETLSGNPNRGKATGKRVIWASDNVQIENGYEFFAKPVTMSKDAFKDFDPNGNNNAKYYQNIAKKASAKLFKTSDYNFKNLFDESYSQISGIGVDGHQKVQQALQSPGTQVEVPIQVTINSSTIRLNVKLTIADSTPKVVSVDTGKATDTKAEKVIFSKENFELSATFKLVDDNGNIVDYNDLSEKNAVKVALYKMNPVKNPTSNDKYKRWANRTNADNEGQDTTTQGKKDKLVTPKNDKIVDNGNGTFTVTYTLLDDPLDGSIQMDWITEKWDHLSEYRIYCWTDSNGENINYGDLNHTGTDSVNRSDINDKVPSVTTKMYLHSKDDQGNLPSAMFKVPKEISLYENGNSVENFGENLTITFAGEYNPTDLIVQHDSKYSVTAQTNGSSITGKPYVEMSNSKGSFQAYYYKQNGSNGFYEITNSTTPLGEIGFKSNGNTSTLRFGLKGKKPSNTNKNDVYKGTATFKFTREKIIK